MNESIKTKEIKILKVKVILKIKSSSPCPFYLQKLNYLSESISKLNGILLVTGMFTVIIYYTCTYHTHK